jgi:pullulanase
VATASGFELHPVQQSSIDAELSNASFSADSELGTFTVPAYTTAVFVKPQMGAQGLGLSAFATAGAPDIVPFGSTTVFVRGSLNGWSEDNPATYVGDGVYEATITLAAGDYEFKIASADWSTVDFGANDTNVELGVQKVMGRSQSNLKMTLPEDATLKFSFDANDLNAPILTVDYEEPFFGTTVFIRGSLNGWSENNPMSYAIGGKYSTTIDLSAGSYEFKIASADWSTVDYGSGEANTEVVLAEAKLLGISGSNMSITIEQEGSYTFVFDASNLNEPTISVFDAQMFGDTTVFVRGSLNGWGEANPINYDGNGSYTTDIALDAGSYEFKVASADWATVDLGSGEEDVSVDVDTTKTLGFKGANMTIEIAEAATYRFTVTGPDPSAPTVLVTQLP